MSKKRNSVKKKGNVDETRPLWQKIAIAVFVVLLIGLGGRWFMSNQYSNEHLATAAYTSPTASGTIGAEAGTNELLKEFEKGHRMFQDGDYDGAAGLFSAFLDTMTKNPEAFDPSTKKFYVENSRWNLLMAQIATGKIPEEQLLKVLDVLSQSPSGDFAQKAKKLKKDLKSVWR